jgi:hypothetical protein
LATESSAILGFACGPESTEDRGEDRSSASSNTQGVTPPMLRSNISSGFFGFMAEVTNCDARRIVFIPLLAASVVILRPEREVCERCLATDRLALD